MRRYPWEQLLRREEGPKGTRLLVLLVLGTYMNHDGGGASASQHTLAAATGLKERAIGGHLAGAVTDGWLLRTRRGHRRGDGVSVSSEYQASLPAPLRHLRFLSIGTQEPVEDLNTHESQPQPARDAASTGTPVPPTNQYQSHQPARSTLVTPTPAFELDDDGFAIPVGAAS